MVAYNLKIQSKYGAVNKTQLSHWPSYSGDQTTI